MRPDPNRLALERQASNPYAQVCNCGEAMTIITMDRITGMLCGIVLLALLGCGTGCQPCNRTGVSASASVHTTHITAPPGGGSRQFLRVQGSNFTPNAPITLSFRQYPASNSNQEEFQETAMAGTGGGFTWEKSLFAMPARNFSADPTVDVGITVKETNGGCFALTSIKTKAILHPPL